MEGLRPVEGYAQILADVHIACATTFVRQQPASRSTKKTLQRQPHAWRETPKRATCCTGRVPTANYCVCAQSGNTVVKSVCAPTRWNTNGLHDVLPDRAHTCNNQRLTTRAVALQFCVVAYNFSLLLSSFSQRAKKTGFKTTFFRPVWGAEQQLKQQLVAFSVCTGYLLHAISCCCMQLLVVACNLLLLLFQDPVALRPPPTTKPSTHKHTSSSSSSSSSSLPSSLSPSPRSSSSSSKPSPFGSTGTSATTDRQASFGCDCSTSFAAIVKACPLRNVLLRGFCEHVVDVTVPQVVEKLIVLCPRSQARPTFASEPSNRFLAVPVPRVIEQFCRCAEGRFSRQNPAADSRTDL